MLGIETTIITIDINPKIEYDTLNAKIISLKGISTSKQITTEVANIINSSEVVMVILDSDHSKENVLNELHIYSKYVNKNSYIIVEDSIVNGHPTFPSHGPGPYEAVEEFLQTNSDFEVDLECQKFLLTFNTKGYLKKIK